MKARGISSYKRMRILLLVSGGLFIARSTFAVSDAVFDPTWQLVVKLVGWSVAIVAVGAGVRLAASPER